MAIRRLSTLACRAFPTQATPTTSTDPTIPTIGVQRKPIIINGAGPAGLVLAHTLKNKGVSFEICERNLYNDPKDRSRRGSRVDIENEVLKLLSWCTKLEPREILRSCSPGILSGQLQDLESARRCRYVLRTDGLVKLLSRGLCIRYGHSLFAEEISSGGVDLSPRFAFESITRTLHGSMMVGADGMMSTVRSYHGPNRCFYAFPAIAYCTSIWISPAAYNAKVRKHLDRLGKASLVLGQTRLSVHTVEVTGTCAYLRMLYSRRADSKEDYHKFHGYEIHQRRRPHVEYVYDDLVLKEIEALGKLPRPWRFLVSTASKPHNSISQRHHTTIVKSDIDNIPERVSKYDTRSAPAVLIGDAANSIPWALIDDSINNAILDGAQLGKIIADRFHNATAKDFNNIPHEFYREAMPRWEKERKNWERKWRKDHAATEEDEWVKITKWVPPPDAPRPRKFRSLLHGADSAGQQFLDYDKARDEISEERHEIHRLLKAEVEFKAMLSVGTDQTRDCAEEDERLPIIARYLERADVYGRLGDGHGNRLSLKQVKTMIIRRVETEKGEKEWSTKKKNQSQPSERAQLSEVLSKDSGGTAQP